MTVRALFRLQPKELLPLTPRTQEPGAAGSLFLVYNLDFDDWFHAGMDGITKNLEIKAVEGRLKMDERTGTSPKIPTFCG